MRVGNRFTREDVVARKETGSGLHAWVNAIPIGKRSMARSCRPGETYDELNKAQPRIRWFAGLSDTFEVVGCIAAAADKEKPRVSQITPA